MDHSVNPAARRVGERFTWLNSQWKLCAYPAQFWVEINIFCFRGRKADVVKLLWFDGIGVSLYAKRLEAGKFVWPSSATGEAVAISAAQLGYLLDGIDWRNPRWTQRPKKMG